MTTPSIDELFERALRGDYGDPASWEAIHALRRTGSREVFDRAATLCGSKTPIQRARGFDVLAQLGKTAAHPTRSFPEEAWAVVSRGAEQESDPVALNAAIAALGHIGNPEAVPLIARHCQHPDEDLRFTVANALGSFPNDPRSCESLLLMVKDSDPDVREWATFALGVLSDADSAEIRDALLASLSDDNEDVREEALVGLSKRKDPRALPALMAALTQLGMSTRITDAAGFLLEHETPPEGWGGREYREALRQRYHC